MEVGSIPGSGLDPNRGDSRHSAGTASVAALLRLLTSSPSSEGPVADVLPALAGALATSSARWNDSGEAERPASAGAGAAAGEATGGEANGGAMAWDGDGSRGSG